MTEPAKPKYKPTPPVSGRWKPGQSGNPGGRPKSKPYKEALLKVMEKMGASLEDIAAAHYARALGGDIAAVRELADRLDGKVPQGIGGSDELPQIGMIITGVARSEDEPLDVTPIIEHANRTNESGSSSDPNGGLSATDGPRLPAVARTDHPTQLTLDQPVPATGSNSEAN